jgi:hypothetical protein
LAHIDFSFLGLWAYWIGYVGFGNQFFLPLVVSILKTNKKWKIELVSGLPYRDLRQ